MTPPRLADLLAEPYRAYSYSYPHKTAYRPLDPPRDLARVWSGEDTSALFLYLHVPFCEQRCGFCNLFTQVQPRQDLVDAYLDAVERQARVYAEVLPAARIARFAIGGGTPTYLSAAQLERLLAIMRQLGVRSVPGSVEVSPATATPDRIAVLKRFGVTRISIGVQSFDRAETTAVSRHQDPQVLRSALATIAEAGFPIFNLDLIYGLPGQTAAAFTRSIDCAIDAGATELYLYPLYVRPLTTLGARGVQAAEDRLALYRAGRDALLRRGWAQTTMRMFRSPTSRGVDGARYRCQDDGMVGLGIGARSYTRSLHYANEYAVNQSRVRHLVADWVAQPEEDLRNVRHGIDLDPEDQRRRYLILSLLEQGVDLADYLRRFDTTVQEDFPELDEAHDAGLIESSSGAIQLTELGIERSDVIGPWLNSRRVRELMDCYVAR